MWGIFRLQIFIECKIKKCLKVKSNIFLWFWIKDVLFCIVLGNVREGVIYSCITHRTHLQFKIFWRWSFPNPGNFVKFDNNEKTFVQFGAFRITTWCKWCTNQSVRPWLVFKNLIISHQSLARLSAQSLNAIWEH